MSAATAESVTPPQTGDVLTLPEAAAYLRVPEEALRELAGKGAIPSRKIGEDWRFLKGALATWLAAGERVEVARPDWVHVLPIVYLDPSLSKAEERLPAIEESPTATPSREESKRRILAAAGMWRDVPGLDEMLREIYRQRGRPMTEEGE